jgi:hypothetical protein
LDKRERLMILDAIQGLLRLKDNAGEPTVALNRINVIYDHIVAVAKISSWSEQKTTWNHLTSTELALKLGSTYKGIEGFSKMIYGGPFARRELGTNVLVEMALGVCVPNFLESSYTVRRVATRLALVRAAMTLRNNPDSGDLPIDPFWDGSVQHSRVGPGWRIWSVGRDGVDQHGATKSDDVVLTLLPPH